MKDWIDDLNNLLPKGRVSISQEEILDHSYDAWSVSIKTRQQGKDDFFPDVIVYPQSEKEVSTLLAWASESKVPVTPWGAGSAVTGAPLPLSGGVSLDMSRMNKILNLDQKNLTVTVQAGIMGDQLENYLSERGLTLNHSPQSIERSTAGGWVATRSTGQFSSRYGGIEDLLLGINVVIPNGEIVEIKPAIRASMGPDLKATKNDSFSGCIMFLGFEGISLVSSAEYQTAIGFCKEAGGLLLGRELVQDWMLRRFDYSTIEKIVSKPAGVAETVEVAHFWTGIYATYYELKKTMAEHVDEVLGHFSHAYPQGTSLYMILLSGINREKSPADAEETLRKIWRTVHKITSINGAMAAHHHGVGIARMPIIVKELGTGMTILQLIKNAIDPSNVLCPGKLGISICKK